MSSPYNIPPDHAYIDLKEFKTYVKFIENSMEGSLKVLENFHGADIVLNEISDHKNYEFSFDDPSYNIYHDEILRYASIISWLSSYNSSLYTRYFFCKTKHYNFNDFKTPEYVDLFQFDDESVKDINRKLLLEWKKYLVMCFEEDEKIRTYIDLSKRIQETSNNLKNIVQKVDFKHEDLMKGHFEKVTLKYSFKFSDYLDYVKNGEFYKTPAISYEDALKDTSKYFFKNWEGGSFKNIIGSIKDYIYSNLGSNGENRGFLYRLVLFFSIMYRYLNLRGKIGKNYISYIFHKSTLSYYFGFDTSEQEKTLIDIVVKSDANEIQKINDCYDQIISDINKSIK